MPELLALQGVSKQYVRGPHELRVLVEVSLTVAAGDFIAVYGQRSAGKTTLMRIAAGLEAADSGTVRFEGRDLGAVSAAELARVHRTRIGWVDRTGPLGDELTVRDYVALPLLGRHRHRRAGLLASDALSRVGAESCADARWAELADAERMQVALAHGLVREPRLLVLDDPTAGLDVIERERIVALLRSVADDARIGVLMAVPDMPSMLRAHDVLSLSGGRLLSAPDPPPGRGTVLAFPSGGERSA
jgi:ABC-type lipoprotein export system ATPase subunit